MVDEQGLPPGLFFKIAQVGELTARGKTALYADIAAGRLQTITAGRARLVSRQALVDYARLLEQDGASTAAS